MTRGEGSGWHRESRRHHDAALKNSRGRRSRGERTGSSTGGMYITTHPVKTVKVGKKKFDIPVGPDGKVPEEALIARFLNVDEGDRGGGRRNAIIDINDYAKVRLEPNPTPEQAKEWWAHPNESDIKGIDDPFQNIFGGLEAGSKGAKEAHKSIAIMGGTPEQQQAVRKAIADSFTVAEQRKMMGTTIFITDLRGAAGEYHGKSYGGSYLIKLDRHNGIDADTVTHELIHHLRTVDDKREEPLLKARQPYYGKDRDLEEAATVAESMARHKPYDFQGNTGYYSLMKDGRNRMGEDRGNFTRKDVVKDGKGNVTAPKNQELILSGKKGRRAVKATREGWPTSNIAHLSIDGKKAEAIDQWYAIEGKNGKTVDKVQVYSPQGIQAKVRPRKGQTAYEYQDGRKVRIAGGKR